ncbi:MAG TPA: hypothetical protein VES19_08825 [Candidatus Limnocylindrales bacterium]|nr:hypothetical protein [Candidatus Limnocylindrales bacterium]
MRPSYTLNQSPAGRVDAAELRRPVRKMLVLVAMLGYPVFVLAWVGLPAAGMTGIAWAVTVGALGLGVILAAMALYQFRRSMAQAPDAQLDERQIRVRDRAYLEAYRVFALIVLLVLLVGGIASDVLEPPITLTYDVVQPLVWGALLYSMFLPSAVVAWQERDLPGED